MLTIRDRKKSLRTTVKRRESWNMAPRSRGYWPTWRSCGRRCPKRRSLSSQNTILCWNRSMNWWVHLVLSLLQCQGRLHVVLKLCLLFLVMFIVETKLLLLSLRLVPLSYWDWAQLLLEPISQLQHTLCLLVRVSRKIFMADNLDPMSGTPKEVRAAEAQAIARAHRRGQEKVVTIARVRIHSICDPHSQFSSSCEIRSNSIRSYKCMVLMSYQTNSKVRKLSNNSPSIF